MSAPAGRVALALALGWGGSLGLRAADTGGNPEIALSADANLAEIHWPVPSDGWYLEITDDPANGTWSGVSYNYIGIDNREPSQRWWVRVNNPTGYFFRLQDHFQLLAQNPAVLTTASGLRYEVLREGTGAQPDSNDTVVVDYEGSFPNGQIFDSSYSRGSSASFPVGGVIAGFAEGLQLMKEGGEIRLHIPYTLGYGASGTSSIPPYATLIFRVELHEVTAP